MGAGIRIGSTFGIAAVIALALLAPAAGASQVSAPGINGSFANGAEGWTSTSSCAPLCTVSNAIDPGAGATTPGSATVVYTTLAGLLGSIASGTSTWTSPAFNWAGASPDSATVALARQAMIGGLISAGGSATMRVQLSDLTSGTLTTIASEKISTADASFEPLSLPLDPSLLKQSHSYRLLLTTELAAGALLSNMRVAYDDVTLTGTIDASSAGSGSAGGGSSGGGNSGGAPSGGSPGGTAASASARVVAPAVVHFARGRSFVLRVRVTRAGRALPRVLVTFRFGRTRRRALTARNGYASIRLVRRGEAAVRVTCSAGKAVTATWLRPR